MILVLIHIFLLIGLSFYIFFVAKKKEPLVSQGFFPTLSESPKHLKAPVHFIVFFSFLLFLLLPLTLGLSLYLKTDGNVLVVIFFIIWAYNWSKYVFLRE
ncbi:hypothetical protein LPTSP3_g10840 [Leptospira kobayashii]|uniref:NADH-quinone oxidoreductase subunit n=2 Tax=Leptospira kobayashii TaxID=1917830 RepID=A0ABN6KB49_9LEPT|nr:hypothetical protein [Leptospira kobayashii]BDA78154.1 hypothetical protein LPTSP3_g10840 [Leptospira kobayashii]